VTALIGMSLPSHGNISNYNDLLLGNRKTQFQKFCSYFFILNFEIMVIVEQNELSMWQALLQI
jgi:hypothetical protein